MDELEGRRIRGWAWRPARPAEPVTIEVWKDEILVASALADQHRGDLESAGKRDGACAFAVSLTGVLGDVVVRTARKDGGSELPGGRLTLAPTPLQVGASAPVCAHGWIGGIDRFGPRRLSGWVRSLSRPSAKPMLELWSNGAPVMRFAADLWRTDLAEQHQGDGRWGFDAPLPPQVCDGADHAYDLRIADGGPSLIEQDLLLAFPTPAAPWPAAGASADAEAKSRRDHRLLPRRPELSVVVNFYNMSREAERTLTSLGRAYQRGIEGLAYEVICVDNGSNPPLDAAWIRRFGPEFRLYQPKQPRPSPCAAMNAAAAQARGDFIAVMIDGAHVLTPGVVAEALRHLRAEPPSVVALRQWFVGGDQRWLSQVGYTREQEDILFDRINWPIDGYELYRVGAPMDESPGAWIASGLSESNCLFVPAQVWRKIGGLDEGFVTPGGGLANLDLFKRAAAACPGGVTCLMGEATFHQYHGGTTTNVDEGEKDALVKAYQREYAALRGERHEGLPMDGFRLAGRMHNVLACATRQRPMYPSPLGVTDRIRPGARAIVGDPGARMTLDGGAHDFLTGAAVELGLHRATRWAGEEVGVGPADLIHLQELIWSLRPTVIVTTTRNVPLLRFVDSICQLAQLGGTPILLPCERAPDGLPGRVNLIHGDPWARETLQQVERRVGDAEQILVLFEAPDAPGAPIEELRRYAALVSHGSYIVYLNTALGQPWIGYSNRWPKNAIRTLTTESTRFRVDPRFDAQLGSTSPKGFIQRVGGLIELTEDDLALDDLDAF
ncbi:MAG TPA: CmcI family methyltransferase [Phenylobacterium sp.]|uniref:CmcI family methyltransferase n=1 Tax=Phenylobacterium sp. TaxID=1871053 RepID=UPI002B4A4465|nr:CmcI family methyltransferase [Phenylobacterium sp.]HKR89011.1 CmcI family methyltransferase [Phenylobacterium sp.]